MKSILYLLTAATAALATPIATANINDTPSSNTTTTTSIDAVAPGPLEQSCTARDTGAGVVAYTVNIGYTFNNADSLTCTKLYNALYLYLGPGWAGLKKWKCKGDTGKGYSQLKFTCESGHDGGLNAIFEQTFPMLKTGFNFSSAGSLHRIYQILLASPTNRPTTSPSSPFSPLQDSTHHLPSTTKMQPLMFLLGLAATATAAPLTDRNTCTVQQINAIANSTADAGAANALDMVDSTNITTKEDYIYGGVPGFCVLMAAD
ncbi:hypothetical protein EJ03DRAFT_348985 [Teratosphaeria nubilosa]|uniref:Ecp2 effector protein domain-containing protein n=1 Tax=Teratosphaeria nubilosa TaxID=161662 RepID=A0A6G1LGV7_9PEZI|nr:hypothetical protein EJ03DRAFT_348985 [Teratosphaeria nubilosa]